MLFSFANIVLTLWFLLSDVEAVFVPPVVTSTPESVKNANKPGSKILGFVKFIKHKEDSICGSFKKKI